MISYRVTVFFEREGFDFLPRKIASDITQVIPAPYEYEEFQESGLHWLRVSEITTLEEANEIESDMIMVLNQHGLKGKENLGDDDEES